MSQEQRRYRAARICHRRPKLRLPNTEMTRRRRRKSGLVAFVRNSLKRPRTLLGHQRLLLPPVISYNAAVKFRQVGQTSFTNTLTAYETREDALPIFWKRPHSQANSKAISTLRRRRYNRYKRFYRLTRQEIYHHVRSNFTPKYTQPLAVTQLAATLSDQKIVAELRARHVSTATSHPTATPRTTFKFIPQGRRKKAIKKYVERPDITASRRTIRYLTPVRSRTNEVSAILVQKQKVSVHKLHSL